MILMIDENPDNLPIEYSIHIEDTPNQEIGEVIDGLVTDEVRRMKKNLTFIDTLEDELKRQVQERIALGALDLGTLQKVIATMNKSIERSNNVIQDKKSNLTQVLIDARTQNLNMPSNDGIDRQPSEAEGLSLASRKRLRASIDALSATDGEPDEK